MTHLCVPIFVTDLAEARRDIASAVGADLIELRIDKLEDLTVLEKILQEKIPPVIVTCRPTSEGGFSLLDDEARALRLTGSAVGKLAAYIDLELATVLRHPAILNHQIGGKIILSAHDFSAKPLNLSELIKEMNRLPVHVNKIVWKAKTIRENIDAIKLLAESSRPTIALCMGEAGLMSRVLARKFRAFLTFASLDHDSATAPGQVTFAEMKSLYRWDAIGQATKVFGVVAHPVRHSMSPAIHNAAFTATNYDGVYLPMLVEPDYESFKSFLDDFLAFEKLDLSGLSITIPHKQNAVRYLKEKGVKIEELAERIGAINTIAIHRPPNFRPTLTGTNTDYAAILDSITAAMSIERNDLRNLRVSILGAGGTSRAAVAALAHYGADITLSNRTQDRARLLADEFNNRSGKVAAVAPGEFSAVDCDVFINTTSIGMYPNVNESPMPSRAFSAKTVVFDTIYNPMKTRLLTEAEAAGARTISGIEMFVRQAAAQFETWTGKSAPQDVMRRVLSQCLAP